MNIDVDISFNKLVGIVKKLSPQQWAQLKAEVDEDQKAKISASELKDLLLNAPSFDENQIKEIEDVREKMNQWRGH